MLTVRKPGLICLIMGCMLTVRKSRLIWLIMGCMLTARKSGLIRLIMGCPLIRGWRALHFIGFLKLRYKFMFMAKHKGTKRTHLKETCQSYNSPLKGCNTRHQVFVIFEDLLDNGEIGLLFCKCLYILK